MAPLSVQFEWEPADGVTHPALAATWGRIEIHVAGRCITTVYDRRTGGTRSGVYGPAMLVAEWMVRNFWFLLYECAPTDERRGRGWRRRHSLAGARGGTSLPDLMLFRDEQLVVADWVASSDDEGQPVRFVDTGHAELEPRDIRQALTTTVDDIVERLRAVNHPDAAALREDWGTILDTSGDDLALCARAARLGVDALDDSELTPDLESCLGGALGDLPEITRNDVLDAHVGTAPALKATVAAVRDLVVNGGNAPLRAGTRSVDVPVSWSGRAFQTGYASARALREHIALEVGRVDLDALFVKLGLRGAYQECAPLAAHAQHLGALVGMSPRGAPRIFAAPRRSKDARFQQARCLFALGADAAKDAPRAVTAAGTRLQAASRAFAAELLAPADHLRERLAGGIDDERVEGLADELGVAPTVIERQIQNHGIAAER